MADQIIIKYPKDYCYHCTFPPYQAIKTLGGNPGFIEMHNRMEAPDAAAEMGNANGLDVLDGTGTPIHIFVISSQAADAAAGTGMRTVGVYGIDADNDYVLDTITLTGAVEAEGAVLFKRVISAFGITFGSGKVAAGNISISDTGQAATYLYIAAGRNHADRMRFWVADGYKAMVANLYIESHEPAGAASVDLDAGSNVWNIHCESDAIPDQVEDVPIHTIVPLSSRDIHPHHEIVTGSDESYISLWHQTVNTGANMYQDTTMLILVFKSTTSAGGSI